MEHQAVISHTERDDNFWLTCTCGWTVNLGHSPSASVEKINTVWAEHQATIPDSGDQPPTLDQMESGK